MGMERNGLVLVTGEIGSRKSSTMASVLKKVNGTRAMHVVTLKGVIEFAHEYMHAKF